MGAPFRGCGTKYERQPLVASSEPSQPSPPVRSEPDVGPIREAPGPPKPWPGMAPWPGPLADPAAQPRPDPTPAPHTAPKTD